MDVIDETKFDTPYGGNSENKKGERGSQERQALVQSRDWNMFLGLVCLSSEHTKFSDDFSMFWSFDESQLQVLTRCN